MNYSFSLSFPVIVVIIISFQFWGEKNKKHDNIATKEFKFTGIKKRKPYWKITNLFKRENNLELSTFLQVLLVCFITKIPTSNMTG